MRKFLLLASLLAASFGQSGYSQSNTFPTNDDVGIGTISPDAPLSLGNIASGLSGSSVDGSSQLLIGGAVNSGVNQGSTNGTYKLRIESYNNDGANQIVYPIYVRDENGFVDFYLKNRFGQSADPTMYFAGDVGIGDVSPDAKLSIQVSNSDNVPLIGFGENGVTVNEFAFKGYFAGGGESGNKVVFGSDNGGAWSSNIMSWVGNGNVGIGTLTPGNKLEVNGTIRSKEIIVETTGWPDYVFEDGYDLPTLDEVELHIEEKGHLPGVATAAEISSRGQSLGQSQRLIMQKIEELTLYAIDKEKRISELEYQNSILYSRLEQIEKSLSK